MSAPLCLHGAPRDACTRCPRPLGAPAAPQPVSAAPQPVPPLSGARLARVPDQPPPAPERGELPAVWDLVLADLSGLAPLAGSRHDTSSCYGVVLRLTQLLAEHLGYDLGAAMRERDATGRERYGTPLQPFNQRAALIDAFQELLDACVYIRQHLYEQEGR